MPVILQIITPYFLFSTSVLLLLVFWNLRNKKPSWWDWAVNGVLVVMYSLSVFTDGYKEGTAAALQIVKEAGVKVETLVEVDND